MHNMAFEGIQSHNFVTLQVYTDDAQLRDVKIWNEATMFDETNRTLYQPWGTNLLPWEFLRPVYSSRPITYWVGSIWDNAEGQGNRVAIDEVTRILQAYDIRFVHKNSTSDRKNIQCVRKSRIAPAIAGHWQVDVNYLPCRVFKNISYGQLGITNVRKFKDILENAFIEGEQINQLVDYSLSLSPEQFLGLIAEQQEKIKHHTYLDKLVNILLAFE